MKKRLTKTRKFGERIKLQMRHKIASVKNSMNGQISGNLNKDH